VRTYAQLQEELGTLVGLPQNLPTIYLLGDTGAGKTCLVRQLLGTTGERFPSVKRHRTTVAPTEFIITNERIFRAGFVMRPESEVEQFVDEILEMTVHRAFNAARAPDDRNISALTDLLANSPDERFRLRCFLNEAERRDIATEIFSEIAPALLAWSEHEFPDDKDNPTVVELGIKENSDIKDEFERVRKRILDCIAKQLKEACGCRSDATYPRTFTFESHNRTDFIENLKRFLSVDDGSVSPAIEKARVRGELRSNIIPPELEVVIIDGEGIGHDAKESRLLSTRHFDYFYNCDAIILVEDGEVPFRAGGKNALAAIERNGYLSKTSLVFSRLDLAQGEEDGRQSQILEVERTLRNVLHAGG
jgi:hypothetical protein